MSQFAQHFILSLHLYLHSFCQLHIYEAVVVFLSFLLCVCTGFIFTRVKKRSELRFLIVLWGIISFPTSCDIFMLGTFLPMMVALATYFFPLLVILALSFRVNAFRVSEAHYNSQTNYRTHILKLHLIGKILLFKLSSVGYVPKGFNFYLFIIQIYLMKKTALKQTASKVKEAPPTTPK